jgi:hypothetical protein
MPRAIFLRQHGRRGQLYMCPLTLELESASESPLGIAEATGAGAGAAASCRRQLRFAPLHAPALLGQPPPPPPFQGLEASPCLHVGHSAPAGGHPESRSAGPGSRKATARAWQRAPSVPLRTSQGPRALHGRSLRHKLHRVADGDELDNSPKFTAAAFAELNTRGAHLVAGHAECGASRHKWATCESATQKPMDGRLRRRSCLGAKRATAQTGHGIRSGRFGFQRPQMAEDQREVEVRGERQLVIWPRGVAQPEVEPTGVAQPEVEPTGVAQPELAVGLMTGRLSSQPVRALWAAASTPADRSQPPHHASPLSTCAADS